MLVTLTIFLIFCGFSLSTTLMNVIPHAQFTINNSTLQIINLSSINNHSSCACQCWSNSMCVTATYQGINKTCSLFSAQLSQGQLKLVVKNKNTITVNFANKNVLMYDVNILVNGDGETGPCEMGGGMTHPMGWSYYGSITQISYNNTGYSPQSYAAPGPSNRGKCYFYGNIGQNASMFQILNLTAYANDIDAGYVLFNLSAWLGGLSGQNDSVSVSTIFQNAIYQIIGNGTMIGPVLDTDRNGINATIFRQATGPIPINSRWVTVIVNITRYSGTSNDGSVDNISFQLKHT